MSADGRAARPGWWLWCLVTGGWLLPVLSHVGYGPLTLEYTTILALAIGLGLGCHWLAARTGLGPLLLALLVGLTGAFYLGVFPVGPLVGLLCCLALVLAILSWAGRDLGSAMRILALVGGAQALGAAAMTPGTITLLQIGSHRGPDRPPVVHLLLDESPGLAAIPRDVVTEGDVERIAQAYVSRGFTVFSRAYSADDKTQLTVARLFNPGTTEPQALLKELRSPLSYHVHRSVALDELSRAFALDLTYTTYANLRPAIRQEHRVARNLVYEGTVASSSLPRYGLAASDRLLIAGALTWNWLKLAGSPLVNALVGTEAGKRLTGHLSTMLLLWPLVTRDLMVDLERRVACCLDRGTYLFAHLGLPHFPYIFDAQCNTRKPTEWLNSFTHRLGELDTLDTRLLRYRMLLEQTHCATAHLGRIADAVAARADGPETVMLVHGDHGSRIIIRDSDRKHLPPGAYNETDVERDNRGTFLALRMPGLSAGIVDTPVRIDDVYTMLVHSGFRRLDIDALPRRSDSPY